MSGLKEDKTNGGHIKAVSIEDLTVKYGETTAISDISLEIAEQDYLCIIGPNGGGKTTLLKALIGLVTPTAGKIRVFGKRPGQSKRLIGYVPQVTSLDRNFPINVHEVVLSGTLNPSLTLLHRYGKYDRQRAEKLLAQVGISNLKARRISDLSGGEFQKMLIARALAVNPKLLLLDEPTASVDAKSRDQIFSCLEELNKSITIILVTHDLFAVSSQVKSLACLNRNLVYHGETELTEEVISTMYGCPIDLIAHGVPHRVLKEHSEKG